MIYSAGMKSREPNFENEASLREILREAATLTKGIPSGCFPCPECGRPIKLENVAHWNFTVCSCTCKRRFSARMKAQGFDPVKMLQRVFREVFRVARGSVEGQLQDLPLLPTREMFMLYATGNLGRIEEYKGTDLGRNWF